MNSYSFETSFGWITLKSINYKIVSVKFGKFKNNGNTKILYGQVQAPDLGRQK